MSATTAKCPEGHLNPQTNRFCTECGVSLAGVCPSGHLNPERYLYCGECGVSIAEPLTSRFVEAKVERGEDRNSHRASDDQVQPAVSQALSDLGHQPMPGQGNGFKLLFWGFVLALIALIVLMATLSINGYLDAGKTSSRPLSSEASINPPATQPPSVAAVQASRLAICSGPTVSETDVNCYSGTDFRSALPLQGDGRHLTVGSTTCVLDETTGVTCRDGTTGHFFRAARQAYEWR